MRSARCLLALLPLVACQSLPTEFSSNGGRLPPSQRAHDAEHLRELSPELVGTVSMLGDRLSFGVPAMPASSPPVASGDARASALRLQIGDELIEVVAREVYARVADSLTLEAAVLMQPVADVVGAFRVETFESSCVEVVAFVPTDSVAAGDGRLLLDAFIQHHDGTVQTVEFGVLGVDEDELDPVSDVALAMIASVDCTGGPLALGGAHVALDGPRGDALALTLPPGWVHTPVPAGEGVLHYLDRVASMLDEPTRVVVYVGDDALQMPDLPTGPVAAATFADLDGTWLRTHGDQTRPTMDDLFAVLADGTPVHATASAFDVTLLDQARELFGSMRDLTR